MTALCIIGGFSLQQSSEGSVAPCPSLTSHPYKGRLGDFVREAGGRVARWGRTATR